MFGNYDVNGAVDKGKDFKFLQTVDSTKWLMTLNSLVMEENDAATTFFNINLSNQQIIIDPLEQFLLMDSDDYNQVEVALK